MMTFSKEIIHSFPLMKGKKGTQQNFRALMTFISQEMAPERYQIPSTADVVKGQSDCCLTFVETFVDIKFKVSALVGYNYCDIKGMFGLFWQLLTLHFNSVKTGLNALVTEQLTVWLGLKQRVMYVMSAFCVGFRRSNKRREKQSESD